MGRRSLVCASPWHEGDRYIASRFDAFERRIEFRRLSDQGREAVILDRIACRGCMAVEVAERRPSDHLDTASLFPGDH